MRPRWWGCVLAGAVGTAATLHTGQVRSADAPVPSQQVHLALAGGHTAHVALYRSRTRGFVTIEDRGRLWTSPLYPLWGIWTADLDADGIDELVLGIRSTTRSQDALALRTIWVMGWDGHAMYPIWRGSSLARPLLELRFEHRDDARRDELVATERGPRQCVETTYAWTGFGFVARARQAVTCPKKHKHNPPRPAAANQREHVPPPLPATTTPEK